MNCIKWRYLPYVLNVYYDLIKHYGLFSNFTPWEYAYVFLCVFIEGVFHVQYNGDPSVRLSPCSGVIAAGTTQWLKVELRTDGPRQINEKAL